MILKAIWSHRAFVWHNAWRDLRHRYAGSSIGFLWNVLHPLFQIAIYTVVFSKMMGTKIPGLPFAYAFAIYLCSGLIPWIAFNEILIRCTNCFIENANYLKKLPIPEQVFAVQTALSTLISLFISSALLIAVCALVGHYPEWPWVALPLVLILLQGFGFGMGLFLGVMNVFFRDVGQVLTLFLQVWFWLTPIVYIEDILPAVFKDYLYLNPLYHFIHTLHELIINKRWPDEKSLAIMFCLAAGTSLLGSLVLRKLRSQIRDVI